MKKVYLLILLILNMMIVNAQPTGYYNQAAGLQGEELKEALNDIISGHTVYSYFYSKEIFKLSDADPQNPSNVIMVYTGRSHPNNDYGTGSDQLNREHVWAKSHGNFGDVQPMDGDVHNLKPVDASVNNDKSNLDYDMGGTQHPEATGCYYTDETWEPRDEVKGDIARILFYMDTRYQGENGELDLTLVDEIGTYPEPEHGKLSTLLQWNLQDPPDAFERNRNNVIYSFQKNRNPFIDDPNLAELIWNNAPLNSITISNVQQSPLVPHAGDPITISVTLTSSLGSITDATLSYGTSWSNLSESIDMDGSGNDFYAEIPGQPQGTTVYFQIEAQNSTETNTTVIYNFYVPKTFSGTITSIYDIQGQGASSPYDGQVVSTTGIVTGNFGSNYFIQDDPGEWNGLFVYDPGRNPSVGDSLVLTGTISEYYEKTEIKSITGYYFISSNHSLPPAVTIPCADAGEPYEGVLIRVQNAECTDANYQANYYMWTVNDGTADLLVHNTSVFEYEPVLGNSYVVTGPLDYDFDEWKIHLRFETDVQSGNDITAPEVVSAAIVDNSDHVIKVEFSEPVDEATAEDLANYSIDNGISVLEANQHDLIKSQVFLTTDVLPEGSYELTIQNVTDLVGNVMETAVIPFTSTAVEELSHDIQAYVYPNPSSDGFYIDLMGNKSRDVTVSLINVAGMKVYSADFHLSGNETLFINSGNISDGIYLLEIRSGDGISRSRVMVSK